MAHRLITIAVLLAAAACGQTQVDLTRQVKNFLPYSGGGTNAASQTVARANVGTPKRVATDFSGADIGAQVNSAFASFPTGGCGAVVIPSGTYTQTTQIFVPTGCMLEGMGRGGDGIAGGTTLQYAGPPATSAIVLMKQITGTGADRTDHAQVRDMTIVSNANPCPNNGMLEWNGGASGSNKWQCWDGATWTSPTPHLAAIQHGQTDPTILADGTHIRVVNVFIVGSNDLSSKGQGAFHFGLYFNGCEECLVESVYSLYADDGFKVGPATNGVEFSQITARINRRAGFHYTGPNHFLCLECLFESNQWFNHPGVDVTKYGAGIRVGDSGQASGTANSGGSFVHTYFEANDIDVFGPGSLASISVDNGNSGTFRDRGNWWSATLGGPQADPSNDAITNRVVYPVAATISSPPPKAAGATSYLVVERAYGDFPSKIYEALGDGSIAPVYQLAVTDVPGGETSSLTIRGRAQDGVVLEHNRTASPANGSPETPYLTFRGQRWTGASANDYTFKLFGTSNKPGGSDLGNGILAITQSDFDTRNFAFYPGSVFKVLNNNSTDTPALDIGRTESPAGYAADNTTADVNLFYRSDADSGSARITSSRFNGCCTSGEGRLSLLARTITAKSAAGSSFTLSVQPTAGQSGNQQEWGDGSATTSYVSPTGAIAIKPTGSQPACNPANRFLLWTTAGGTGVKDSVQVCAKDSSDAYAWRTIF